MDESSLRALMDDVVERRIAPDDAVARLRRLPFAELGHTKIDHHRALRQGMPEAIYAPGKSPDECVDIVVELLDHGTGPVVLSRADDAQAARVLAACPGGARHGATLVWRPAPPRDDIIVGVVSAGTADGPVAAECAAVLDAHGVPVRRITDVGVAGLHRLLAHLDEILGCDVVVTVAGMEGALPSVIGGLLAVPVIAVPTSVGYGSGLDGVTALLAMHSSCASGITVVGIDNGFGAACAAMRVLATRNAARG